MGEDEKVDAVPTKKRPRTRLGEMKRVAEIVMVLSAMGEMRGGEDPTPAERAMAAEAREMLAEICGDVLKPKDLFPTEAVRAAVEDLGLNRAKDPMTGFRPPKMSIAEKLLLTKKKMEESKEISAHSSVSSSQPSQVGFGAHSAMLHGTTKFSPMSASSGGFQTISPVTHVPGHTTAISSLKHSQYGETHHTVTSMTTSTASALPHAETTNLRSDARFNVPPHMTQVVPGSTQKAASPAVNNLGQAYNLPDHSLINSEDIYGVNAAQTSHQVIGNPQALNSEVQGGAPNLLLGHQPTQGLTLVLGPSLFTNHSDIAKSVQKILQPKVFNHPDWIPPSSDYTNKPINCQICKIAITDVESLLICDNCEKGTHLKCLQSYNNKGIPKAEWHCPRCLMSSNGKPLPPKYGRVTRSTVPSKASSNTAVTHPASEKRVENPETKVIQQKIVANANSGLLNPVHTSGTQPNHSESIPDLKAVGGGEKKVPVSSVGGKKIEDEMHTVAASHSHERGRESEFTLTSRIKNESSNTEIKNSGSSTHDVQISVSEPISHHESELVRFSSNQLPDSVVETTNGSQLSSDSKIDKETKVSIGEEASTSQLNENSKPITNEPKEPSRLIASAQCKIVHDIKLDDSCTFQVAPNGKPCNSESNEPPRLKETFEQWTNCDIAPDERNNVQATSNGDLSNDIRSRECGQPSAESSTIDWVGDILEVSEQKNFYQSCRISGVLHKLQDQILVSSKSHKLSPSKLKSLWEDKKTGSKWASVSSYYFPENLLEVASLPSSPENNEVYASNNESMIPASSICGPCNVLPADKFTEESNRRALLKDIHSGLHPIFMCRWKYDESNGTFQSFTD